MSVKLVFSPEGQIPKGAVYLGKKDVVDGDQVHTDTYYAKPTTEETTTTKTVEHRPKKYDGIGPLDQEGVPLAFRKVWETLESTNSFFMH